MLCLYYQSISNTYQYIFSNWGRLKHFCSFFFSLKESLSQVYNNYYNYPDEFFNSRPSHRMNEFYRRFLTVKENFSSATGLNWVSVHLPHLYMQILCIIFIWSPWLILFLCILYKTHRISTFVYWILIIIPLLLLLILRIARILHISAADVDCIIITH